MEKKHLFLTCLLVVLMASCVHVPAEERSHEQTKENNATAKIEPVFEPLAPGNIQASGWLRDWAVSAKDGFVGHLDEYEAPVVDIYESPAESIEDNHFGLAWNEEKLPYDAVGSDEDGTGWPLEQCAYWLDGALRLGYVLNDAFLINKIEKRLDIVVDGVNGGGDTFIYWLERQSDDEFNGWAHSHMGRALVAYYRQTQKPEILNALEKVYGKYRTEGALNEYVTNLCNVDPMVETLAFTGNEKILNNVLEAMENVSPVVDSWAKGDYHFSGHTVVMYENIRLPMLLYPWTGDKKYLDASLNQDRLMRAEGLQPYGVLAGMEHECGRGAFRKTETCNIACHLWNDVWFLRITGESRWCESAELAFFNAGPGPIARDYKTLSYWLWPNRIIATEDKHKAYAYPYANGNVWTKFAYPPTLCCVASASRIMPLYISHMWMKAQDNGLAATFYGPCEVSAKVNDKDVHISCETDYPFRENIDIHVNPQEPMTFPLYFRIPDWCEDPQVTINGEPITIKKDKNGFLKVLREWSPDDSVNLVFPMKPRLYRDVERDYTEEQIDYYAEDRWGWIPIPDSVRGKITAGLSLPFQSIYYGPLLFSLPLPDDGPAAIIGNPEWRYALNNDAALEGQDISATTSPMPEKWDWPLDAPIKLKVPAKKFDWKPERFVPLPGKPVTGGKEETITLVPFGSTYFRISMFPMTEKAWRQ